MTSIIVEVLQNVMNVVSYFIVAHMKKNRRVYQVTVQNQIMRNIGIIMLYGIS